MCNIVRPFYLLNVQFEDFSGHFSLSIIPMQKHLNAYLIGVLGFIA